MSLLLCGVGCYHQPELRSAASTQSGQAVNIICYQESFGDGPCIEVLSSASIAVMLIEMSCVPVLYEILIVYN